MCLTGVCVTVCLCNMCVSVRQVCVCHRCVCLKMLSVMEKENPDEGKQLRGAAEITCYLLF